MKGYRPKLIIFDIMKMYNKKNFFILFISLTMVVLGLSSCQKNIRGNGYVFDKQSGLAIEGATVRAYLEHPSPDTYQMQTNTDKHGSYFVNSQPYACSGTCPDLYVSIVANGYQLEYVKNPHGDTTFLLKVK